MITGFGMPASGAMVTRALVAAGLLVAGAGTAVAQQAAPPVITVRGEAEAELVPDTAEVTVGVDLERPTAAAAAADVAGAAQAVMAAAKAGGIAERDVRTTDLSLGPVDPDPDPAHPERTRPPRAFRAATAVRVRVHPATEAGALASRLVGAGANTLESIAFLASDLPARRDALRAEAMRDARRKADIYAAAAGIRLGQILEIAPEEAGMPRPEPMMVRAAMASKAAPLPSAPGILSVSSAVTVRWALEP